MSISERFSIINIDKLEVEIGQVEPETATVEHLLKDSEKWDNTLSTLYEFKIDIKVGDLLIELTKELLKLVDNIEGSLEEKYRELGYFRELKLPDISTPAPLTKILTGINVTTCRDLKHVLNNIRQQILKILEQVDVSDRTRLVHCLLHTSSLFLPLLEILYILELCSRGCISEKDACYNITLLTDTIVRSIGVSVVSGTVPGIVVMLSTSKNIDYMSVARVVAKLAEKNFLIIVAGSLAKILEFVTLDDEGHTVYDLYPDNVIKCVPIIGTLHYAGVLVRAAEIFAGIDLGGNISKVHNYVFTKLGACAVVVGPVEKMLIPVALALCRLGVPIITYGVKLPIEIRSILDWWNAKDAREGKNLTVEAIPRWLLTYAEDTQDLVQKVALSCFRICDNSRCRLAKLSTYISLSNGITDDVLRLVRTESEIPLSTRDAILNMLRERGWSEREVPVDVDLTQAQ